MRSYFKCLHTNVFSPWWGLGSKFRMENNFNGNLLAFGNVGGGPMGYKCASFQEADSRSRPGD